VPVTITMRGTEVGTRKTAAPAGRYGARCGGAAQVLTVSKRCASWRWH
jgi:hypothetical protein